MAPATSPNPTQADVREQRETQSEAREVDRATEESDPEVASSRDQAAQNHSDETPNCLAMSGLTLNGFDTDSTNGTLEGHGSLASGAESASNGSTASGTSIRARRLDGWLYQGDPWSMGPALVEESVNDTTRQRPSRSALAAVAAVDEALVHTAPVGGTNPDQIDPHDLQETNDVV
ncbi:hypothetical protein OQA88_6570 [Cercophora sp. LCS_1]